MNLYRKIFSLLKGLTTVLLFMLILVSIFVIKNYEKEVEWKEKNIKTIYRQNSATKNPIISIIIPIYNSEKYLKECLDSLVKQTFKNIEIICVNDDSKDNSLNILKEYAENDDRIIIIDKINGGCGDARNKGIQHASGKYLMFLDSDDYYKLNTCETCYNKINEHDADIVVFGWKNFIDDNCKKKNVYTGFDKNFNATNNEKIFHEEWEKALKIDHPHVWNKIFKKSVFDNTKFTPNTTFEDAIFIYSIYPDLKKIVFIPDSLYKRRLHDTNISLQKSFSHFIKIIRDTIIGHYKIIPIYLRNRRNPFKLYSIIISHASIYKGIAF